MSFAAGVRALAVRSSYLEGFARWGPVFKTTQFGAPVICVTGMDRICRLLRGHNDHLGPSPLAFARSMMGNFLRYMDDEAHGRYGGLFRRAMADVEAGGTEEKLRERCRTSLVSLAGSGPCHPGSDLYLLTRQSLDQLLFGLGGDDLRSVEFGALADRLNPADLSRRLSRSNLRLIEEMAGLLKAQVADGGGGSTSALMRLRALDPLMPDRVCLENLIMMHKIGTNNVSSLLLWLVYWWGTRPDVVVEVRSLNGPARERSLQAFLCETLRLGQSEYLYRKVERPFEFEGFHFPVGWLVRSCIWESHRTAEEVDEPAEFRLRLAPGDYKRGHYSPFGMGQHACNGVEITQGVCLALLNELADGFDVELENAEPFQRRMRHWSHWHPNREMTVKVRARDKHQP